jgi:hypothetical protein
VSNAAAGWYPQPDGQQRYWDGEAWTQSFAPGVTGPPEVVVKPVRPWFKKKRFILPAVGVALIIIASTAGGGSKDATPTASAAAAPTTAAPAPAVKAAVAKPAKPVADAGAQLSCVHFSNVMGDFSKGLLTSAEMRVKLQEVYDSAKVSQNVGIPEGATAMLRDSTADDGTTFLTDSLAFSAACAALG